MADPTEPLTEIALQHIVSLLQGITVANGYWTDIGAGYLSTEPTQRPEDANAYVAVFESETTITSAGKRVVNSDMSAVVQVIVPITGDARKPANVARRATADIVRALREPMFNAPAGVRSITPEGKQRLIFDDEKYSNSVIAQVPVRVGLSESIPPATQEP